ncbi:MAG: hypothetical protein JXR76_30435 [Deltaproteobacteria bacterium]|nr:hypothetical protein [Deltaproteobacteria bacterium]
MMKAWGMTVCLMALVMNSLISCPLFADTSPTNRPVVLIISQNSLNTQKANPQKAREKRFITQTRLALDQFRIITVSNESSDFSEKSFSKRIETVRRMARQHDAVAALWLEETASGLTLMHLVAFSSGRPMVRIVDARTGPDAALELSLAAQELLSKPTWSAQAHNVAILPAAGSASSEASSDVPTDTPAAKRFAFSMMVFAALSGGISDVQGNPLNTGGGTALERGFKCGFRLRAGILFLTGLQRTYDFGTLFPFGFHLEIGQSYLFDFGKILLGPATVVSIGWEQLRVDLKTTGKHVISWWRFSMNVAMDMRVSLSERLGLLLQPAVVFLPRQKLFYLDPEGETIYMTPRFGWSIKLGLNIFF